MKNTIKKSEMRGQFIDMQKTRGGIPARLRDTWLSRHDLERIKVPYVIGQTGWHKGSRPKPINKRFFHCTDYKKVAAYCACLYHLSGGTWLSHIDDEIFIELTNKYGFFYPEQYKARVRELATTK